MNAASSPLTKSFWPLSRIGKERALGTTAVALDHIRRAAVSLAGFGVYGFSWLRPWCFYCLSPVLNRIGLGIVARFVRFDVRLGEGDIYTFANTFEDYPVELVRRALREVDQVVDLGANVGAFSCLAAVLCQTEGLDRPIKAVEPNTRNVNFLRGQPFACRLEIYEAAVGPKEGIAWLIPGENSVTDHVDFCENPIGLPVRTIALETLCDRPTLLKMDIEGAERTLLQQGLPPSVRHLFLEWHQDPEESHSLQPSDLIKGDWRKVSRDLYGSSMWYLRR